MIKQWKIPIPSINLQPAHTGQVPRRPMQSPEIKVEESKFPYVYRRTLYYHTFETQQLLASCYCVPSHASCRTPSSTCLCVTLTLVTFPSMSCGCASDKCQVLPLFSAYAKHMNHLLSAHAKANPNRACCLRSLPKSYFLINHLKVFPKT